jgi:SRSO17 transposase
VSDLWRKPGFPAVLRDLVGLAKLRWWIERDYKELKQELGLGH